MKFDFVPAQKNNANGGMVELTEADLQPVYGGVLGDDNIPVNVIGNDIEILSLLTHVLSSSTVGNSSTAGSVRSKSAEEDEWS